VKSHIQGNVQRLYRKSVPLTTHDTNHSAHPTKMKT